MSKDYTRRMPIVIIESPYAGEHEYDIAFNVAYARAAMHDAIVDDRIEDERDLGITAGFNYRRVADRSAFCIDLGWSTGMRHGHAHALKKVFERTIPGWAQRYAQYLEQREAFIVGDLDFNEFLSRYVHG